MRFPTRATPWWCILLRRWQEGGRKEKRKEGISSPRLGCQSNWSKIPLLCGSPRQCGPATSPEGWQHFLVWHSHSRMYFLQGLFPCLHHCLPTCSRTNPLLPAPHSSQAGLSFKTWVSQDSFDCPGRQPTSHWLKLEKECRMSGLRITIWPIQFHSYVYTPKDLKTGMQTNTYTWMSTAPLFYSKVEATQMSIRIDKMWYIPYSGILFGLKNKWST